MMRPLKTVLILLACLPLSGLGQAPSADEIVLQLARASAGPILDMACEERATVTSFVKDEMKSQHVYESIVATPRTGQRGIDLNTSYREILSINGKPVRQGNSTAPTTANMTTGGAWLGTVSGWVISQRRLFNFTITDSETLGDQPGPTLALHFERKKDLPAPWYVPDFGKAWIDPQSKRMVRFEIHDSDLTPMLPRGSERTIVEDFGTFIIDGEQRWLVKTWILEYFPTGRNRDYTRTKSEISNCRRFDVSSTIKPLPAK